VEFLVGAGVDRDQLVARGYGETRPILRERSERAWTKNRRVQFIVTRDKRPLP
jgi:outer membrane protein OmpA-like peptidoglycan-associated protein